MLYTQFNELIVYYALFVHVLHVANFFFRISLPLQYLLPTDMHVDGWHYLKMVQKYDMEKQQYTRNIDEF